MVATLVTVILRCVAVAGALQLLLNIVGNNLYELQAIKRRRQRLQHPYARHLRHRPLVSVLIVTRNDAHSVGQTLESIIKSSYRNLEIVIADLASTDKTRRVVTDFRRAHPNVTSRLCAKRRVGDPMAAAVAVYKQYGQGQLVMILPAGYQLQKPALSRAVTHFNADQALTAVLLKVSVRSAYSVLGILQRYQDVLGYRRQKTASVFRSVRSPGGSAVYRRPAFLETARGARKSLLTATAVYYADDAVIYSGAPQSFLSFLSDKYTQAARSLRAAYQRQWLTLSQSGSYRKKLFLGWQGLLQAASALAAVALPVLTGYFVYLAISLQASTYLLALAAILSLVLLFAIWDDGQLNARQKLQYTAGIPLTYGYFLLLSVIEAAAIIGTLATAAVQYFLIIPTAG